MSKLPWIAFLAGLMIAGQALADPSAGDRAFATAAAQSGLAEVQEGQMAAQKAVSAQIRQFGQRMVADHGQANQDLQQIAQQENFDLPTQPSARETAEDHRLSGMIGSDFDRAYIQHAMTEHMQAVVVFRREAQSGRDPALKDFARKYLPVIQRHLQLAQSLSGPQ